jgi:hypothetical protein
MKRLLGFRYDVKVRLAHLERGDSARRRPSVIVELLELDTQPCGDRLDSRRAVD